MNKDIYILGISCFFHDSSIALMKNGEIIFATEEEKLSRIKHDNSFPILSINKCLEFCSITIDQIDYVGFYEKPFIKFENFLLNSIFTWPFGYYGFIKGLKEWLNYKLFFKSIFKNKTGYKGEIIYIDHHLSHAAGAFYGSGFNESAVLVIDGVGEHSTTSWGIGNGNDLNIKEHIIFPNSIGLLYSTFTAYLGFEVNDGEYKMMGLAPYGKPIYSELIKDKLVKIDSDGNFNINMEYFSFRFGKKMFNKKFELLFGLKGRCKTDPLLQIHKDIASSIQKVTEDMVLNICNYIYKETKLEYLSISGGVGLNCVLNYLLLKQSKFKNIFVQPSPGDGGSCVGVCQFINHFLNKNQNISKINNLYLGESFSNDHIINLLESFSDKLEYKLINDDLLFGILSDLLLDDKVVGWFQGRTEFGPRALGNRSILGNPLNIDNWQRINLKIKFRESFRPFAPSITEEDLSKYYDIKGEFPYMLFIAKAYDKYLFPAVIHIDGTSRVQTVNSKQNSRYYKLLKEFESKSGFPVLINTSFNLAGEPIVNSPKDAIETFLKSEMDYLTIENYLISKK